MKNDTPSPKGSKAQAHKDSWIAETQTFQRIAREGKEADSYESLSAAYDKDLNESEQKRASKRIKK